MEFNDLSRQRDRLRERLDRALDRVLDHGQFILGPEVKQLEEALADYTGSHVVTCANGTDALVLAMMALDIGPGVAVAVPSFSFCATAEAVRLAGATPVFADVDPATGLMTSTTLLGAIEAASRAGLDLRGVIVVDLFGQPVEPDEVARVAAAQGAAVICDAAQSFGATFNGVKVGAIVPITTTSFFPSKPLGCYGDGGAIIARDNSLADTLRSLRVHGQGRSKYDNVRVGMNSRLDTLQAAVLLEKLAILDDELNLRRAVAARYAEKLRCAVGVLQVDERCNSAWSQFTIVVEHRDELVQSLSDAGIPSATYYRTPLHKQPAYVASPASDDLSGTEWLADRVVSLPMHPYLSIDEVDFVAAMVTESVRRDAND